MNRNFAQTSQHLILAVLVVLVAAQLWLLWHGSNRRLLGRVREIPHAQPWRRSAELLEGQEFADFMGFLRQEIPEDKQVLLPPHLQEYGPFQYVTFMQYFLFPREILNCGVNEVETCIERVLPGEIYIVAIEGFPPGGLIGDRREFVEFSDEAGVFLGSDVDQSSE